MVLVSLGAIFFHVKGEPTWHEVISTKSIGEMGSEVIAVVLGLSSTSVLGRTVYSEEQRKRIRRDQSKGEIDISRFFKP